MSAAAAAGRRRGLLLLAAPRSDDAYYRKWRPDLVTFYASLTSAAAKAESPDAVIVVADKVLAAELLRAGVPPHCIAQAGRGVGALPDVWVRDYGPVPIAGGEWFVQLKYAPRYMKKADAQHIASEADRWFTAALPAGKTRRSGLVCDGGNVVRPPGGQDCITTSRVVSDNGKGAGERLQRELGCARVCVVPEFEGDQLGHSDGMAAFLADRVVALNADEADTRAEVERALPGSTVVPLPCDATEEVTKDGFSDCTGIYANLVATECSVFVPSYGDAARDAEVARLIAPHLQGRVLVTVPMGRVPKLGGSVRCLSWELTGPSAEHLIRHLSAARPSEADVAAAGR